MPLQIPKLSQDLIKALTPLQPPELQPSPEIEWNHPYLVFLAEHGYLAKNAREEQYGISLLQQIPDQKGTLIELFLYEVVLCGNLEGNA